MLWIDKCRPKKLSALTFNNELTVRLRGLCQGDLPHMIVGGPDGSGKRTRIMACLSEVYGDSIYKTRIQHREYKLPSKKIIELTTVTSNHHIEIDISEARHSNRVIIQEIVDEITGGNGFLVRGPLKIIVLYHAEYLNKATQHSLRKTIEQYSSTCRFILSTNSFSKIIDQLHSRALLVRVESPDTTDILVTLQKITMQEQCGYPLNVLGEIAQKSNQNLGHAIMTLQRLALAELNAKEVVYVPSPEPVQNIDARKRRIPKKRTKRVSNSGDTETSETGETGKSNNGSDDSNEPTNDISVVSDSTDETALPAAPAIIGIKINEVIETEVIETGGDSEVTKIAGETGEAVRVLENKDWDDIKIPLEDWEEYIIRIVEMILGSQSVTNIVRAREYLYELLGKCIEPDAILKRLTMELFERLDAGLARSVLYWAAKYDYALILGGKPIIHIEAFIVKCMELYKKFLVDVEVNDFTN